MTNDFDLVVVGSGPAGEKAAAQAAYFGKSVAVVEARSDPGGIAVSSAGIPTKALRESAIYLSGLGQSPADLSEKGSILARLMARKDEAVSVMTHAVRRNLTRHRVELVHGRARLLPERRVEVTLAEGGTRVLSAKAILLATGGRAIRPSWLPAGDPAVRDSESILRIDRLPSSLLVIGEGAVGCEYASIFGALGVKTTLLARSPRLMPAADAECSRALAESFNGIGIRVLPRSEVLGLERHGGLLRATLASGKVAEGELALVAMGRTAATDGLGLAEAGVALRDDGHVLVSERYETTAPGVYAAGDLIGPPGLAAAAMEEGRVAVCHALELGFKTRVDALCPMYVFSIPELASVGLTEEAARERGRDVETGRTSFSANAKARVSGFADGILKLVFDRQDERLLGVHIVGEQASELIHLGQLVLHEGGTLRRFIDMTFAVPTRSEAYKYAAYDGLMRLARRRPTPAENAVALRA